MIVASPRTILIVAVLTAICTCQAWCGSGSFAADVSDATLPLLVAGELSLIGDKREALQGAKALVVTYAVTETLKHMISERRPNNEDWASFPSGHTSTAFAMATVIADYRPKHAVPVYAIASTIGWSRVEVGAHRWRDVVAGAALGYFTAKHFTNDRVAISPRGISYGWKW